MTESTLEAAPPRDGWLAAFAVYLRPRVLIVMLLGFSSGLPLALSGATLAIWMADRGVDLGTIGLFSLVGVPYTIKFLWAPLVDALDVPLLTRWLGRRRGWLALSQLLLAGAIVLLGSLDPVAAPLAVAAGALLVAVASATQDIVIDAYRVESLETREQAAGMAAYVMAYRIGMLVSGAGVIALVAWLEYLGAPRDWVWFWGYAAAAAFLAVGFIATLLAREPSPPTISSAERAQISPAARILATAIAAFREFLARDAAIAVLLFVLLFKFCDAFAGVMTGPFVLAIGFDKASYAAIVKGVGLAAALTGGVAGGLVARALPLSTSLWIAALLQMGSNLAFVWQSFVGANHAALTATIVIENFTGSVGTVIFVAYLSALCRDRLHTATQFALLTALAAVGRTTLASGGGFLAQAAGWPVFFTLTALSALPAIALLWWLDRRGHFAELESPRPS
jgi:PAT family beta-lactamase induction signal transducer AmpG